MSKSNNWLIFLLGLVVGSLIVYFGYIAKYKLDTSFVAPTSVQSSLSFSMRQQCITDANNLIMRLNQEESMTYRTTQYPTHISYHLLTSVYSKNADICVAEIVKDSFFNGKSLDENDVYDTTSGDVLIHYALPGQSVVPNYIAGKSNSDVTDAEINDYKVFLGLSQPDLNKILKDAGWK
ncbi:MAG: hypothetical protein WCL07_03720 [bacterium]